MDSDGVGSKDNDGGGMDSNGDGVDSKDNDGGGIDRNGGGMDRPILLFRYLHNT
jgi:hypothetical protein